MKYLYISQIIHVYKYKLHRWEEYIYLLKYLTFFWGGILEMLVAFINL